MPLNVLHQHILKVRRFSPFRAISPTLIKINSCFILRLLIFNSSSVFYRAGKTPKHRLSSAEGRQTQNPFTASFMLSFFRPQKPSVGAGPKFKPGNTAACRLIPAGPAKPNRPPPPGRPRPARCFPGKGLPGSPRKFGCPAGRRPGSGGYLLALARQARPSRTPSARASASRSVFSREKLTRIAEEIRLSGRPAAFSTWLCFPFAQADPEDT